MSEDIQQIQSAYRRRILDCWNIPPGSRILEIGCGQGDMTAVLAEAGGPQGHVTAVDIANRDYGAPLNLGQATDLIKGSKLGERIDFHFEFDVTNPRIELGQFDFVVMAHCSWYLPSREYFKQILGCVPQYATKLCFAEWDLDQGSEEQKAHAMAVLILRSVAKRNPQSQSNVRCGLSMADIWKLFAETGWYVSKSGQPDTSDLQDADWEIRECLHNVYDEARRVGFNSDELRRLQIEIDALRGMALPSGNVPLGAVALVAQRR